MAYAFGPTDHRNTAAAAGDHDRPPPGEHLDQREVHDVTRSWRGHHMTPAATRVFEHEPPQLPRERLPLFLGKEWADGLARLLEGRVLGIDLHLRQETRDMARVVGLPQRVLERLH